jgi:dolichyl-phosphate-mannose-protein mannosyltransferase
MNARKIHSIFQTLPWFWIAIATLFFSSLALRFWGLGRFNRPVFDEVYYVKYAKDYLTHTPFFDVHPPLGKYLIAFAIWISNVQGWIFQGQNSAFDSRWLNALTGSLVPLIVAGIAYQLSNRRSYAVIAGLLTSADGLLLVESRYALLSIYIVFLGLLGQWCFLLALNTKFILRWLYLILAGIFFGATISVKWYGLGFLLGIYLVCINAWLIRWWQNRLEISIQPFVRKLTQLKIIPLLIALTIVPAVVYYLIWIPHLQIYPNRGFWALHEKSWTFHQQLGNNAKVHPYCSPWYSWVLMIRPVAYLYETSTNSANSKIVYDVHGMGNPILWWLSAIAILCLIGTLVQKFILHRSNDPQLWIKLYILLNYGANWLPWMLVHRCSFIYYYLGAVVFGFLAIAYWIDRWLCSDNRWWRAIAVSLIFAILWGFAYWLPIYLGLPLNDEEFHRRMWFDSWY